MAFDYRGSLAAGSGRAFETSNIIVNSATVRVGDFVGFSSGYVQRAALGNTIYGLCIGIVNVDGVPLDRADSSTFDGTWTTSTQTYIATSDNQTDKKIKCVVLVDPLGIYSGPVDAALGTTTGSDLVGYYSDILAASNEVDESSAVTTTAQLAHLGKDPANSARMLYAINEGFLNL